MENNLSINFVHHKAKHIGGIATYWAVSELNPRIFMESDVFGMLTEMWFIDLANKKYLKVELIESHNI